MKAPLTVILSLFLLGAGGGSPTPPKKVEKPTPSITTDEVQALIDAGQFKAAETKARRIIKNKKNPRAYNLLGLAYRKQKKYKQAIRAYKVAVKLAPNYWQAYEYLGVAYLYLKNPKRAKSIHKILFKRAPDLAAMLQNEAKKLGYKLD